MLQVRIGPGKLNDVFADFADHHGFAIKTHRPYRPRTKGKVERQVDYVKDNFLAGRSFEGLDDLNAQGRHWLNSVANVRVHGTTGRVPQEQRIEEPLTPLSATPTYRLAQAVNRSVSREAMVHFQGSRYSVPPAFAGETVQVQTAGGLLVVRCGDLVVAEHPVALKARQSIVAREHLAELWWLTEAQTAVPTAAEGCRWHLRYAPQVDQVALTHFEEITA